MSSIWHQIFDRHGIKTVSKTDKAKSAYVLNKAQLAAVYAAGIQPAVGVPFPLTILLDPQTSVTATFYLSLRTPPRTPEPRMGTDFVNVWLNSSDKVVIGNIGSQLFASKITDEQLSDAEITASVSSRASNSSRALLIAKAKLAKGPPKTKKVERTEFVRSSAVVLGALARAAGDCEMPTCVTPHFTRDDGTTYLEVHHVVPLAEGGDDTLLNAAALCPRCHREVHSGTHRAARRATLAAHVTRVTESAAGEIASTQTGE